MMTTDSSCPLRSGTHYLHNLDIYWTYINVFINMYLHFCYIRLLFCHSIWHNIKKSWSCVLKCNPSSSLRPLGSPIGSSEEQGLPPPPPHSLEESSFPRALGTTVFGFETILTGLVYLSFGIFLYQMIQRAVDARVASSLTSSSGGRNLEEGNAHFNDVTPLLQSLEKVGRQSSFLYIKLSDFPLS